MENQIPEENLNKLETAFIKELALWHKTTGSVYVPKLNIFFGKIENFNFLLFNTKKSLSDVKALMCVDKETQETMTTFLARVKYKFIELGGDWNKLVDILKGISEAISKDKTFGENLEGYEQTSELVKENTIQVILFGYIMSPNMIAAREKYGNIKVKENE